MCVSHHIKFFETFPVKPRPQAWKLQVKPLYHRSPKNSSQVLERAGRRSDSSSFWIQAGSLEPEDAQSMTWDKSCQVGDVCPPCGGPLQGGQRWLHAPSRQAAEKCCIASFQNATIIGYESVPSWSPRIRASLLDTQPVRLYRALCSGGPALAYCSVAAILKFLIGWLLVMFCFVFNKGPACNGHHLVLGFTNYEAGPVWDLCPSLNARRGLTCWDRSLWDLGCLATGFAPGQMPPWVGKYKETTGTKNNCWGKLQATRYKKTKK